MLDLRHYGATQLGERLHGMQEVSGSIPNPVFCILLGKQRFLLYLANLDYQKKNLTFSEAVLPSLLDDEIMYLAQVFYRDAKGLHPDNFGPVRLKTKD